MNTHRALRFLLLLTAASLVASGCSSNSKRLKDTDRIALGKASAIHVFYYDTPLPQLRSTEKKAPTPADVRKSLAADPASQVASQFARTLARQEKLRNVQTPQPLPRPVVENPRVFRDKLQSGLVLELWTEDWTIGPAPGDAKSYALTLKMQARLSNVQDGKRLWTAEGCRTNNTREQKLSRADLTQGTRLRKVLAAARDECSHQLLRDFSQRPER